MYHVLVVDDEELPRKFLFALIPVLDPRFTVVGAACDGNEALEFIRREPIDLLITDIRMPEKDGLRLSKEVHQEFPHIKICVLSGHEEFQYVRQAMLYRAEEYILKPINKEDIQAMLGRVAERLDTMRSEEATLRGLLTLSDEARKQVAVRFMQALINQSDAEISTLYPLVHRLKIPIFEGEGILLLLGLDERSLFSRKVPPKEYTVFHYILNQVASELAARHELAWTLFDPSGHTSILLSGTDPDRTLHNARALFGEILSKMRSLTKLTVSGGLGCRIEDVFQLRETYQSALAADHLRFREGREGVLIESSLRAGEAGGPNEVERIADLLRSMHLYPDAADLAAKQLTHMLDCQGAVRSAGAYNLGAYMLNQITGGQESKRACLELAWNLLAELEGLEAEEVSSGLVESVYVKVFSSLADPGDPAEEEKKIQGNPSFVGKVLEYIDKHYREPISLAMIADHFQISPQYLSQLFHKQIGVSYIKYVTRIRMEQASRLLGDDPDMKVYEVAEKVGFDNVKHFMYVFKKYFGKTPGEFRSV